MQQSKGFSAHDATVATIIGNVVSTLFRLYSQTLPNLFLFFFLRALSRMFLRHYGII